MQHDEMMYKKCGKKFYAKLISIGRFLSSHTQVRYAKNEDKIYFLPFVAIGLKSDD